MTAFDHWVASEVASLGGDYGRAVKHLRAQKNRCTIRLSSAEPLTIQRPQAFAFTPLRARWFSTGKQGLGAFCFSRCRLPTDKTMSPVWAAIEKTDCLTNQPGKVCSVFVSDCNSQADKLIQAALMTDSQPQGTLGNSRERIDSRGYQPWGTYSETVFD